MVAADAGTCAVLPLFPWSACMTALWFSHSHFDFSFASDTLPQEGRVRPASGSGAAGTFSTGACILASSLYALWFSHSHVAFSFLSAIRVQDCICGGSLVVAATAIEREEMQQPIITREPIIFRAAIIGRMGMMKKCPENLSMEV